MKKQIIILIAVIGTIASLSSCKREFDEYKPTNATAKTTSDLKAPAGFNWNTTNHVQFTLQGINGDQRKSTLKITTPTNDVIFQRLQNANDTYSGKIEVPAHVKTIIVTYNGVSTPYDISKGEILHSIK